jgi:succinoglycan biosynthesis transport protein ExoP
VTAATLHAPPRTAAPRLRTSGPLAIRDVLTPLLYYKHRALIGFLIPLVVAMLVALMSPPVFVADSRLLILLGDDYVFKGVGGAAAPGLSFDKSQIVHAETEILGSRDLKAEVVKEIGVNRLYPGMGRSPAALDAAVARFSRDLTIDNVPQSNVLALSYRNRDRAVAAQALNKLINLYLDRRRSVFEQSSAGSLQKQIATLDGQLADTEGELVAFSRAHDLGDYQQDLAAVQQQQASLSARANELEETLAMRQGRQADLLNRRRATPPVVDLSRDVGRSQQVDLLTQQLVVLLQQRRDAAAEYVDGNALVADLDKRIRELRREIDALPQEQGVNVHRGQNPVRQQLDSQLVDAAADAAAYRSARADNQAALARANRRLQELVAIGPQYRELMRNRVALEGAATDLAKQAQTLRLSNSLSRSQANVRVLEAAQAPTTSHSGRMMLLLAGVGVGCIMAGAVTVLSMALFEGMLTPHEVEQKIDLPVILWTPETDGHPLRRVGELPTPRYLSPDDVKALVRQLHNPPDAPCKSVMMIGGSEGVGVTSLLADVAVVLAQDGRRILLLEPEAEAGRSALDLLRARGVQFEPGPGGALAAKGAGLHVISSEGSSRGSMGEAEWKELLQDASLRYDMVLVDAPPLSRSWLGLFAAPSVDATLLVIGAEDTRAPVARNMIARLNGAEGAVIGAILNKRRFYIPRTLYNWL